MKQIKSLIFTAIALSAITLFTDVTPVNAQGYLQLINGKQRRFSKAEVKGQFIRYVPEDKPTIEKKIDRFDIFSVNYDDGKEDVLYNPDTTFVDEPSVEEVRDYIEGERLALKFYHENPKFAASQLYFGFYSGFFGSLLGYYGAAVPLVYSMGVDRFGPVKPEGYMDEWKETDAFVSGYEKRMRNKKIKNSLIGGAVGFTIGITTLAVIFNE